MKKKAFIIAVSWAAVIVCMAVIFGFSAQAATQSQELSDKFSFLLRLPFGSFIVRKGAHFLEFAGLATLIFNALYQTFGFLRPVIAFIITAAYAASDEIHQLFVDGRACRIFDWFVDCSGALSAILFLYLVIKLFSRVKRRKLR